MSKYSFNRQRVETSRLPVQIVQKWSEPVLTEGFVPFPKKLLRCMHRLFEGPEAVKELAVVLAVADFNRLKLNRLPSLAFLSFVAGLVPDEVPTILKRLEEKAYIAVSGDENGLDINISGLLKIVENETRE